MGKSYDRSEKTAKLNQRKLARSVKELERVAHTRTDDKPVNWTRNLRHATRACMVLLSLATIPHAHAWPSGSHGSRTTSTIGATHPGSQWGHGHAGVGSHGSTPSVRSFVTGH
jgi:hypothetical protein